MSPSWGSMFFSRSSTASSPPRGVHRRRGQATNSSAAASSRTRLRIGPSRAVVRSLRRGGGPLNRSFCIPTVTVHCTVTRETRKKPSRREKYWVSDPGTGVAHPLVSDSLYGFQHKRFRVNVSPFFAFSSPPFRRCSAVCCPLRSGGVDSACKRLVASALRPLSRCRAA